MTGLFTSQDPATGEHLSDWPQHTEADVAEAVARAADAQSSWYAAGFSGRRRALNAWRGELAVGLDDLVALMHTENGKPRGDAILEIMVTIDHLAWAARHARSVLASRRVPSGLLALNQTAISGHQPFGVVGVVGPWNYPVLTPMGSLCYALAAGNAVVFKPSEFTPGIGAWLVEAWRRAAPDHAGALQLVTGGGATGAALCQSGVQKIAFTGSAATGRRVLAQCAEGMVPVLMECGGKDAAIVLDDADLPAAADAILWGGMSNAGQTCLGIERVYVTPGAHDRLVAELVQRAEKLRPGADPAADYGPMTMPSQVDVVRRHLADAVSAGAVVETGGAIDGPWIAPTILTGVPHTSSAVQEETFGPTLTVTKVSDAEEAVRLTNGTPYGLGAAVFTRSARRGTALAAQLRSGMASVNSVMAFASVPSLPLGGVGESGFGRIHGPAGLREFSRTTAITRQRFPLPVALASFDRTERTTALLATLIRLRHGRYARSRS